MSNYLQLVKDISLPTEDQTIAFVGYVATAHSWYKHLDYRRPSQFVFYLDPYVMMKYDTDFQIMKKEDCWHYSSLPTSEYHQKYGYWTYAYLDLEQISIGKLWNIKEQKYSGGYLVPDDLVIAGSAFLTSDVYGKFNHHPTIDNENIAQILQHKQMLHSMHRFLQSLQVSLQAGDV